MSANLAPHLGRVTHDGDFSALRGMLENLSPVDLAGLLVRPADEDQVITFLSRCGGPSVGVFTAGVA